MIRYQSQHQLFIEEFRTPFEMKLSRTNRWVKLAQALPWDALVKIYCRALSEDWGRPAVDPRIVIGSFIIKHKDATSDEETIVGIQENPYKQYFLGLPQYQEKPVFDSSLFVTLRRRLGSEAFDAMVHELMRASGEVPETVEENAEVSNTMHEHSSRRVESSTGTVPPASPSGSAPAAVESNASTPASSSHTEAEEVPVTPSLPPEPSTTNAGTLIVDMSVAPADIAYPTDLNLLNTAREQTERLIDLLYVPSVHKKKPRTYRLKARKDYLAAAKKRKKGLKTLRKALRKQLNYVGRNLRSLDAMLDTVGLPLPDSFTHTDMRTLWIVREVYRQQKEMFDTRTNRIDNRLVSIFQPHVRPIVRGKDKAKVEFGAQVSVSIMNGFRRIHRIEWDAYNEASDLKEQVENYKTTYGVYPEIVLADKKYGTKDNRAYMKAHNITYGGTPLGRPKNNEKKQLPKEIINQRNYVEGTFGTGKRSYGLDCVKARSNKTSQSWIAAIFFVMNLSLVLQHAGSFMLYFFKRLVEAWVNCWKAFWLPRERPCFVRL